MGYKDSQFYSSIHDYYWKNVLLPAIIISTGLPMKIITESASLKSTLEILGPVKKSIGLVPTMGALHQGHESLVRASKDENDLTIVSIFVNPIQFNNLNDLDNYPSSTEEDLEELRKQDCDIVFLPSTNEMYPSKPLIKLNFGYMDTSMEGAYRPGHFSGVGLVVMKLFNIMHPTRAYFGQKDLQQYKIIETMVTDTSQEVELRMMPIIREPSGLAMSSRNSRLNEEERKTAMQIYKALQIGAEAIAKGLFVPSSIKAANDYLQQFADIKVEYITLVNLENLQKVESVSDSDRLALCFAGYIGEVRLIDNIII